MEQNRWQWHRSKDTGVRPFKEDQSTPFRIAVDPMTNDLKV